MRLPRPQLHLSTCIVLMFVAGGLMGFNLVPRHVDKVVLGHESAYWNNVSIITKGWPCTFQTQFSYLGSNGGGVYNARSIVDDALSEEMVEQQLDDGVVAYRNSEGAEIVYKPSPDKG